MTLIRHGESTEFDVAVIFVGEWILTADELRGLEGDMNRRFMGDSELRFEGDRERRGGSAIDGPVEAERGSGDDEWYGIVNRIAAWY
jgi:hypothetical protein